MAESSGLLSKRRPHRRQSAAALNFALDPTGTRQLFLLVPPAGIGPAAHGLGIRNSELSALLKKQPTVIKGLYDSTIYVILSRFSRFWIKSLTQILTQK
jgi:hypothetical protein